MNFYRDKQIKEFSVFLFIFALLFLGMGIVFGMSQINDAKALLLAHDEAVASSLLGRGVSRDVVAAALYSPISNVYTLCFDYWYHTFMLDTCCWNTHFLFQKKTVI